MSDIVTRFKNAKRRKHRNQEWVARKSVKIRYKIIETKKNIKIEVELFGIKPESIKLHPESNFIILEAEKKNNNKITYFLSLKNQINPDSLSYIYSTKGLEISAEIEIKKNISKNLSKY